MRELLSMSIIQRIHIEEEFLIPYFLTKKWFNLVCERPHSSAAASTDPSAVAPQIASLGPSCFAPKFVS